MIAGTQYLLVIGTGGLGLFCLQFAKFLLPPNTRIIAADIEVGYIFSYISLGWRDCGNWWWSGGTSVSDVACIALRLCDLIMTIYHNIVTVCIEALGY